MRSRRTAWITGFLALTGAAIGAELVAVAQLVDARKTLAQHRRLLVADGWLSLLAATLDIDLRQQ